MQTYDYESHIDRRVAAIESSVSGLSQFRFTEGSVSADDNSEALQDLIDSIPTNGGVIVVPPGDYHFESGVTVPAAREISFVGESGWTSTVPRTTFTFNGTGSGSFITASSSVGLSFKDMGINYTSTSFTGVLVDLRNASANDSAYWLIDHCSIGGVSVATSTAVGLAVNKAIDGTVRNSHFYACSYAIDGMTSGNYSNGITVQGNVFHSSETAHIHNMSEAWTVIGNVFEGLRGGGAGAIKNDAGVLVQGGLIASNWSGDVTAGVGGSQYDAQFMGTQISGNYIGASAVSTGITLQAGSVGFAITGNRFAGMATAVNMAANCNNYTLTPNSYSGVTTQLAGTTGAGLARSYVAAMTAPLDVYRNTSSTDGRCVVRYQADRGSTKQYDVGIDPDGGQAKMWAVRDLTSAGAPIRLRVPSAGGMVVGSAALATDATDGFMYLPSGAGAPTGTPTSYTGTVPAYVDTTNSRFYLYIGGAWKMVAVA